MELIRLNIDLPSKRKMSAVRVYTQYHKNLFCSFKVLNEEGYLFTLVPSNNPFADFQLSGLDKSLNHDIDVAILTRVKSAIINYFYSTIKQWKYP